MSTINYSSFETPTGSWAGSNITPPELLKDYQLIASSITDLDRSNPIITFSFGDGEEDASAKLKVVSGKALALPFNEAYVDISSYNDYIIVKNNSGVWVNNGDLGAPASFSIAYTSGGFWAMGTTELESPGVIFKAYPTGIGDYSYDSIIALSWMPINQGYISETLPPYFTDLNDDPSGQNDLVFQLNFETPAEPPIIPIKEILIRFDDNGQSWCKRRINITSLNDVTGITINGLANNTQMEQSIVYTSGVDLAGGSSIEFYWSGNNLYKEISPSPNGLPAPAPFNNSAFNIAGYGTATVYANEPMIGYEVINNHSIRLTTTAEEVAALIPPLRKLYVNFSGITA
jgi:hypothetical protein